MVSSNNDNGIGHYKNSSRFFEAKEDVSVSDSSVTEALAFKYSFEDEKKAIKTFAEWEKSTVKKKDQIATLKEILEFLATANIRQQTEQNSSKPHQNGPQFKTNTAKRSHIQAELSKTAQIP